MKLNPQYYVGFMVPIESWLRFLRTLGYLWKCYPFAFSSVVWFRGDQSAQRYICGHTVILTPAFCLSCFVDWMAGLLGSEVDSRQVVVLLYLNVVAHAILFDTAEY